MMYNSVGKQILKLILYLQYIEEHSYCNSSHFYAANDTEKALKMEPENSKVIKKKKSDSPLTFKEVNCPS